MRCAFREQSATRGCEQNIYFPSRDAKVLPYALNVIYMLSGKNKVANENAYLLRHFRNVTRCVKYIAACLLRDPNFAANYIKIWLRLCHADNADNGYIFEPHYKCSATLIQQTILHAGVTFTMVSCFCRKET